MSCYELPPHVVFCTTPHGVVFLDIRHDRYMGLPADSTDAFRNILSGRVDESTSPLANELRTLGLLQLAESAPRPPSGLKLPRASTSLLDDLFDDFVSVRPSDTLQFFMACLRAAYLRRFWPFERILRYVTRRRTSACDSRPGDMDLQALHQRVLVFRRLRPLLYSAPDHCVYDSLALLEFLAAFHLYPNWVIAVNNAPFAAHCWLQHQHISVTDSITRVSHFTPIYVA